MLAATEGHAQFGPVRHNGYLEYQYRNTRNEGLPSNSLHLATWRTNLSTFLVQPWILQLDGSLALTETRSARGDADQDGSLVTGGAAASLFPRSPFPFRAFLDVRDSRVEGDISVIDLRTTNYGFLQQLAPRNGGRVALEYRHSDNDELFTDGARVPRDFTADNWQLTANKALGRHDFRLLSTLRSVERKSSGDMEDRNTLSLRHRFRTGPRFFIEDTTFYSDERIVLNRNDMSRRFLQFNGISTWRPDTEKPLLVTGRALLQGTDAGAGDDMSGATQAVLTGAATWQTTENVTLAANVGVARNDADTADDAETSFFQRLRTTYRADDIDMLDGVYRWGGTSEIGNRRESEVDGTIQDLGLTFNHGLTHNLFVSDNSQLQINFTQQLNAFYDTQDRRDYSMLNTVFATLTRQSGRNTSYLRVSATDRRLYGDREAEFQLVNLQMSTRTQVDRNRSWNGSVTLQYQRNVRSNGIFFASDDRSTSYSANLSFIQRDLFGVQRLNFMSELRWLSNDFQTDDPFDRPIDFETEREDRVWRNRLDYRIGRLEMRFNADAREINGTMAAQVFLQLRRYYGDL